MFMKKFFDVQNVWGKVLFWVLNILSSIALVILTALWGAASFFKVDTTRPLILIGIYFLLNLLINFLITKENRGYLFLGIGLPIIVTVIFWKILQS